MDSGKSALILIGYQNDYFAPNGILHHVIEEASRVSGVLQNTLDLVERVSSTDMLIVSTPILFTENYEELVDPVGILKTIKEVGAFREDTQGGKTIDEIARFGDRIVEVPGKRGLNAFSNTELEALFHQRGITDVLVAGVVTSICVDSTGRAAFESGFRVSILSDCTCGRTPYEQEFYCGEIFPLYARVLNREELLAELGAGREQVSG